MKQYVVITLLVFSFMSCRETKKKDNEESSFPIIDSVSEKRENALLLSEKEYMLKILEQDVGKYRSVPPDSGYVPNEETAKKIAEAVWWPIYGERINEAKPFQAYLVFDSIWVVMAGPKDGYSSTPHIEIKKRTGEILFVMYYK